MAVEPHDVFTPAGSLSPGMFATRAHETLERTVSDALQEAGRHVIVHGWTGVGKTALVEHVLQGDEAPHLQVECGGTFEQLMHLVLSRLSVSTPTGRVDRQQKASEVGGGLMGTFTGKASRQEGSEVSVTEYTGPIEGVVVSSLAEAGVRALFIDNLEDLRDDDREREGLCRLIKVCSASTREYGAAAPKVVVAGPTAVVQELLLFDEAAARRTEQIEVPRMSSDEIEQILVRGQEKLEMTFDDECRAQIVAYSGGFPYYAHLYALHCSRVALRDGTRVITARAFDFALAAILSSCSARLKEAYSQAIRGRGQPALREGVMAALTASDRSELSGTEVQEAFLALHPQYERVERVRFVGRLLRELRDDHALLEDAWLDDGRRGYRFRDPLMRVYVRLRLLQTRQRADAAWRSSLP